jgi:4-phosphopantoate--beta-alanine ligase
MLREKLSRGMKKGIVHETGLIAHGRGEAFDYLLDEQTIPPADEAAKTAASYLLLAENPIVSVNGNVAVLSGRDCVKLSQKTGIRIEVNLFHSNQQRILKVADELRKQGAQKILGLHPDQAIPGLEHSRGRCSREGIFTADVVLVALEDGDRCQALKNMGKTVLAIDLNPLSRTAQAADVTIVDNVIRAIPQITHWVTRLTRSQAEIIIQKWDNKACLRDTVSYICAQLQRLHVNSQ